MSPLRLVHPTKRFIHSPKQDLGELIHELGQAQFKEVSIRRAGVLGETPRGSNETITAATPVLGHCQRLNDLVPFLRDQEPD